MDTRTTRMTSPEEKSQSSTKPETQGDLWREIAEEGYDRIYTQEERDRMFGTTFEERYKKLTGEDLPATAKQQQKQETPEPNATASTAPIIEEGKTLDELVPKNDALGQHLIRTLRARGATDQEIWQFMLDN